MQISNLRKCLLSCTPVVLSGFVGYFSGKVSALVGLSIAEASTISGFCGFMMSQAFAYVCLLLENRYHKDRGSLPA